MTHPIKTPKKLIEVALPLDDINLACAREKSIRHGHPSTLHLWWARRPLAAARAVIFAQMVNDPGYERHLGREVNKKDAQIERERLFTLIRKLVLWENTNNEAVLNEARAEIWKSWRETCALNKSHPEAASLFNPEKLPAFHDPFAGGGAIPLEAQRLGLESYASDLNPVAVLINKAMIEIPPKFAGLAPVGPLPPATNKKNATKDVFEEWSGAKGLAEDVRRYGYWMREEAFKRIGHHYPQVDLDTGLPVFLSSDNEKNEGNTATVIAWIWARTVKSPNPAFSHVDVPLISTFILSSKKGKETWVEPIIDGDRYSFKVRIEKFPISAKAGTKVGRGGHFKCLISGSPIHVNEIRLQGKSGGMGQRLLAVVAEGKNGRHYISPTEEMEDIAKQIHPEWKPETEINHNPRDIRTQLYGLTKYSDLFTLRQLETLNTFSNLIKEAHIKVKSDAMMASMLRDRQVDSDASAYSDAVALYLAFVLDKMTDLGNNLVRWEPVAQCPRQLFGRQAIPMIWDFAEANPFSNSSGSWDTFLDGVVKAFIKAFSGVEPWFKGTAIQAIAQSQNISNKKVISTDPPYYDNIGYADLSDFFYVWMRRSLKSIYPELFATISVPKAEELVATPYRHGNKQKAEKFFLDGMTEAMHRLAQQAHPAFPTTIYYAFKSSETTDIGTGNTGWETFLEAVLNAGYKITGTWPMRTENASRMVGQGTNALASSIVLVCYPRLNNANTISRREFIRELKEELTEAIEVMIGGAEGISPVAPVDLAQAVIGPGMAIFSKYAAVLEADGNAMSVHDALVLINRTVTEGGDDFDADSQFCLAWFDEYGWSTAPFGQANTLAQAKGTSVQGVQSAGVVESGGGNVRLLKWAQYPNDWSPENDNRTPVWEALHHLIRVLNQQGESAAGHLLSRLPERSAAIRQLAYRLYTLCERKGWAEDARAYNELMGAWTAILSASLETGHKGEQFGIDQFFE